MKLPRKDVPEEFCSRFCCAFVAGRCIPMTVPKDTCLWTAAQALDAMGRRNDQLTKSIFAWMQLLRRKHVP